MRTTVGLILLAGLAATACSVPASADDWTRTYPISDHPELSLITDDGQVRVVSWDRDAIGIHVVTQGIRIGDGGVRITDEHSGDHVQVEVREPRFDFSFHHRSIRIEVSIPSEADLDVRTGDGGVTVAPLHGTIRVHTGDGGISVEGLEGDVELETGDGEIAARDLDGRLDLRTGDGAVSVQGRFEELVIHSGDGNVEADVAKGSRVSEAWGVTTGDGDITLRIPGNLKADLDARTGDGRIDVDLPVEVSGNLGQRSVRGRLNGGGPPLRLRSGDGSIRIERE